MKKYENNSSYNRISESNTIISPYNVFEDKQYDKVSIEYNNDDEIDLFSDINFEVH